MTSRRSELRLGLVLSAASFGFSWSAHARAQDVPPAPLTPPAGPEGPAPNLADAPAGAPAVEPAKEPEADEKELKAPPPLLAPTPGTASGTSVEREKAVSLVGVEQLPGSAYPSVQNRGIKYGSLWLTFHGQQWPYMPAITGEPSVRFGLSGSLWNDFSYTQIAVDGSLAGANLNDQNRWTTQTRGVLRVTPTYNANGGWFVQGNAELVLHGDMRPDPLTGVLGTTDDLWVRIGKWNSFDVTLGRFQGWEIANHFGMGLDQNTLERSGAWIVSSSLPRPTDGYGLSYFWDRQDNLLGGYAVHVYPTKYLRGELLGHFGAGNLTSNPYQIDVRPSAIFDIGYVKLKAGWEFGKAIPQDSKQKVRDSRNGYGFAAQFVLAPYVEFGASFARGFEDVSDQFGQVDLSASNSVRTFGGFLNASPGHEPLVFGLGAFQSHREDFRPDDRASSHRGKVDTNDQLEVFGAAQYTLWQQLYFKFVLSHARNHVEDYKAGTYTNNALSGRFRVMLLF
jgi:hypothetical protein